MSNTREPCLPAEYRLIRVVELTIRELIEEQRRRIRSSNPAERLAAALLIPAELARRLKLLSDSQLGQLLEDEVWSYLNLLAPEATICLVAADRLQAHMEVKNANHRRTDQ